MPKNEKVPSTPDPDSTYEEDMQILRVIEAYCTTNKRQTQAQLGKFTQILFICLMLYARLVLSIEPTKLIVYLYFFLPIACRVILGNV